MLFNFEFFETNSYVIRCTSEKLDPNSIYSLSPEKRYRYEKFFQKPNGFNQHWTISMPIFNNFHRTFWYLIWLFRFLIPKRIHQPMLNITYPIFWNPMFILWQGFYFSISDYITLMTQHKYRKRTLLVTYISVRTTRLLYIDTNNTWMYIHTLESDSEKKV